MERAEGDVPDGEEAGEVLVVRLCIARVMPAMEEGRRDDVSKPPDAPANVRVEEDPPETEDRKERCEPDDVDSEEHERHHGKRTPDRFGERMIAGRRKPIELARRMMNGVKRPEH